MGKFGTYAGNVIWPKLESTECLTRIFLPSEFACFEAGEIIQVIETLTRSVVPLAIFHSNMHFLLQISSKFSHWVTSVALVPKLAIFRQLFAICKLLSETKISETDTETFSRDQIL